MCARIQNRVEEGIPFPKFFLEEVQLGYWMQFLSHFGFKDTYFVLVLIVSRLGILVLASDSSRVVVSLKLIVNLCDFLQKRINILPQHQNILPQQIRFFSKNIVNNRSICVRNDSVSHWTISFISFFLKTKFAEAFDHQRFRYDNFI